MTIRKKLILSNILMICIPALFILVFGAAAFKTYGNRYWQFFEEILEDTNGLYSAQSIVYKYREDLAEENQVKAFEDVLFSDFAEKPEVLSDLEQDLLNMGYHFRLSVDGEMVFSSITREEEERIGGYFLGSGGSPGNLSLNEEGLSLIKNTFESGGAIFEITAVRTGDAKAAVSYFQRYVAAFVILIVLLVAVVIVLTNVILSLGIMRAIMKPLNILKEGTGKIADGDLDWTKEKTLL